MMIIPLTPPQASFVELEIIERHFDDDEEHVADVIATVASHFERTARMGHAGLAVADAKLLRSLILDEMNAIDDAIDSDRSMQHYGLTRLEARALHRCASALYRKIPKDAF